MDTRRRLSPSWMAAVVAVALAPLACAAQDLALKRVMLSAGGVGYFEHEAEVDGDATLELSVRLDQVDDVMKSIVVYDDRGVAGTIRLAGRNPIEQIFRDLPFGPEALESPVALLNAMPGSEIRASGQRRLEGRLVRVVPETHETGSAGGTLTRHRVSVLTAAGMQSFLLEEADAVTFTDPALAGQIDDALAAIAAHRARERRTLHVLSSGAGRRTVRVGYVVSAPLWKASYRLALDDGDTARLQGWAVLENMSGQAWRDVELTLVSGNPVTFRQALYAAYYADRPEVPVETLGRVLPVPDTGTVVPADIASSEREQAFRAVQGARAGEAAREAEARQRAPAIALLRAAPSAAPAEQAPEAPAPPPLEQARILAAASAEAATSVSFRIPYPVSVGSGQSLLVAVIDRAVPARRLALYQPATHARHPLAAVRLVNDGASGLPPGVLTLYETGGSGARYIGDAQLAPLPAGEERLVSYALDQKTTIDREIDSRQTIAKGRIVNGILEITYAQEQRTLYRAKAPASEARTLLIEHPRQPGWKLEQPDTSAAELTESHYRIERALAAGQTAQLPVVLSRPLTQTIALVNLATEQLAHYASTGELDAELRSAFERLAALSRTVDERQRSLETLTQARDQIHREQERIRSNLSRIPRDSDLHARYMKKLDAQEDRLEGLLEETAAAQAALDAARGALGEGIAALEL